MTVSESGRFAFTTRDNDSEGVKAMDSTVFTIGHSEHTLDAFLALLKRHEIGAVADVRSAPYSRHVPDFNNHPRGRSR